MDYKILWKGSPNYWRGRFGRLPVAVVDHIIAGTMAGADSRFQNSDPNQPGGQASAHFGVSKKGEIWQWVHDEDSAWGNGIVDNPNHYFLIDWLAKAVKDGTNPNLLTISIEHEGQSGDVMPEEQYQATLWLHRYLFAKWKLVPSEQTLIRHRDIDSVNRPYCPGLGFPHDRLLADLKGGDPLSSQPFDTFNELEQKAETIYVNSPILDFWKTNGGLTVFGKPITHEVSAASIGHLDKNGDGQADTVQFFERGIIEFTKTGYCRGSDAGRQILTRYRSDPPSP